MWPVRNHSAPLKADYLESNKMQTLKDNAAGLGVLILMLIAGAMTVGFIASASEFLSFLLPHL
jgi:hypothetical protein